jgi:hypothetical protein
VAEPNRLRDQAASSVLTGSATTTKPTGPPSRENATRSRRRDRLVRLGWRAAIAGAVLLVAALFQTPPSIRLITFSFGLAATGVGLMLAVRGTEWLLDSIRGARRSKGGVVRAILMVPHEFLIAEVGWLLLALGLFVIGIAIIMPLLPHSSGG